MVFFFFLMHLWAVGIRFDTVVVAVIGGEAIVAFNNRLGGGEVGMRVDLRKWMNGPAGNRRINLWKMLWESCENHV